MESRDSPVDARHSRLINCLLFSRVMFAFIFSFINGLRFGQEHITPATWVILGLLGLFSTVSWAALLMKWLLLRRTERANRRFLRQFHESPHPLAIYLTKEQTEMSPLYYLYHAAAKDLAFHLVGEEEPGEAFPHAFRGRVGFPRAR